MNKQKLEQLLCLVVIALVIEFILGTGVSLFINKMAASRSYSDSSFWLFTVLPIFKLFLAHIVGAVLGWWLYTVSDVKKNLWFFLGLFAVWWALLVFALFKYTEKEKVA